MPDTLTDSILRIWREVLRRPEMTLTDDLFDLGGDSTTMTRIAARMKDRLDVDIPLDAFFEATTVQLMTTLVTDAHRT
jgi:acyl carrier protein